MRVMEPISPYQRSDSAVGGKAIKLDFSKETTTVTRTGKARKARPSAASAPITRR
jgi:phage anti-repressor protein